MRNIGCSLTLRQIYSRRKTQTRRLEWLHAKPGMLLQFVDRTMGFKKDEHPQPVAIVRIEEVRREYLDKISPEDVQAEGFPLATPDEFVEMFSRNMACRPTRMITVLKFRYVPGGRSVWDGICRRCGCTEDDACESLDRGSCWWVEFDLCSHCAADIDQHDEVFHPNFQGELLNHLAGAERGQNSLWD